MKKYFVITDIHAEYEMMMMALIEAGFELENPEHIIITLGDNLDRGNGGHNVIIFLSMLYKQDRLLGVLGNHDNFILQWIDGNKSSVHYNIQYNGFGSTIDLARKEEHEAYNTIKDIEKLGKEFVLQYPYFVKFLRNCPLFLEFDKHIFVHGALNFKLKDWRKTKIEFATWEYQSQHPVPKELGKTIVVGHQPTLTLENQRGLPVKSEKLIRLDGGATYGGRINVLVLNEDEI
jgi:serine/threonine protein phosphatase 1